MEDRVAGTLAQGSTLGANAILRDLIARYDADMVRVASSICDDPSLALDSVQAAWHKAWLKLSTLRDPEKVRPWLLAIAANEARQARRAQRRRRWFEVLSLDSRRGEALELVDFSDAPAEELGLGEALSRLPDMDRTMLGLRYAGGLTAEEIGDAVGLSASGVRTRLQRVRERLKEDLEHERAR